MFGNTSPRGAGSCGLAIKGERVLCRGTGARGWSSSRGGCKTGLAPPLSRLENRGCEAPSTRGNCGIATSRRLSSFRLEILLEHRRASTSTTPPATPTPLPTPAPRTTSPDPKPSKTRNSPEPTCETPITPIYPTTSPKNRSKTRFSAPNLKFRTSDQFGQCEIQISTAENERFLRW